MESLKDFIDLLSSLLGDGVIDGQQYARILQTYNKDGIIDFSFTEEELNNIKKNEEESFEGIDLDNLTEEKTEKKTKLFGKKN